MRFIVAHTGARRGYAVPLILQRAGLLERFYTDVCASVGLGKLVGIAHYLFHTTIWAPATCYLQDLFVDSSARGQGAARALIENVAAIARERGAQRLYWHTQEHNATARMLYDKLAKFSGFIRYEFPL